MRTYYESGKIKSIEPLKNGKKEGLATYWNPDGSIYQTKEYADDMLNGKVCCFDNRQNKLYEAKFKNAKLHGDYIMFENNDTLRFNTYKEGEIIRAMSYTRDSIFIYDSSKFVKAILRPIYQSNKK